MSVYRQVARLYDAIYSFKDYPAEAARLHELIQERRPNVMTIDEPGFKLVRMNTTWVEGRLAVMDMHHLLGGPEAVEHFVERVELALYTHEEYLEAFRAAGLRPEHDAEGLMGRGLYLGTRAG